MPQDLPGFYYDSEKNRYFPMKGPIPGSSRTNSSSNTDKKDISNLKQVSNVQKGLGRKTAKLIQVRELYSNVITSRKGKFNFQEEYQKSQASQPMIWKYNSTVSIADGALEQTSVDIDMPDGRTKTNILLTGGVNGSLCLCEAGRVRWQQIEDGLNCIPEQLRPLSLEKRSPFIEPPPRLSRTTRASAMMSSNISSIKMRSRPDNVSSTQQALWIDYKLDDHDVFTLFFTSRQITTIGSESSGGSLYILNLREPLNYFLSFPLIRRLYEITNYNCTVWTADCNSSGTHAVIGTDLGASLVNIETGTPSWVFRCKSDVLALQIDQSGNNILCGLRNGAILTVDIRERPQGSSSRLIRHRIPHPSLHNTQHPCTSKKSPQWFEGKGNLSHVNSTSMTSSISCLASLKLYGQYFLASSMDGSIKLYDHRRIQRGAIQSYEGNVNSHTRTQLGVDPSERFVMSGGEDCFLRLWSIKSGELIFSNKFMNSVPSVVCWSQTEGNNEKNEAWLGSHEGLFYSRWL